MKPLSFFGLASLLVACGGRGDLAREDNHADATAEHVPANPSTPEPALDACDASAAARSLRLPREGDRTVAPDSGVEPKLLAYATIPSFCSSPTKSPDPDELVIGCGEQVTFPGGALEKRSIRIAAGGTLRLTGETVLTSTDILVCPNAVIQAGGEPSRDADGKPGNNLTIAADQLVVLGTISTSGGFAVAPGKHGGAGGVLDIHVSRLLLAGAVETFAEPPAGAVRGEGGMLDLIADDESFFSGTVRSGNAYVKMPVCCAD